MNKKTIIGNEKVPKKAESAKVAFTNIYAAWTPTVSENWKTDTEGSDRRIQDW
jgi:hypothetical protein